MLGYLPRAAATLALGAALGCTSTATLTDPRGHQNALEESQRKYTQLVRWGEIEKASAYVEPDSQEEFLSYVEAFESIRVTDYETGSLDFGENDETASVDVTYPAYSLVTMLEAKVRTTQEWFRSPETGGGWRVRPELSGILEALQPTAAR